VPRRHHMSIVGWVEIGICAYERHVNRVSAHDYRLGAIVGSCLFWDLPECSLCPFSTLMMPLIYTF
jgi:hypothetical protein